MGYQPHLIANYEENGGLDGYYEPFLMPEKAFPNLQNAYAWRGQIKKKWGIEHLGRLRRDIGNAALAVTNGTAGYTSADIVTSVRATEPYAEIQPGTVYITIDKGGANESVYKDNSIGGLTYLSGPYTLLGGPLTINYASGALAITFDPITKPPAGKTVTVTFFYYPGLPVMGLPRREVDLINSEDVIAFDTKYAYKIVAGLFQQLGTATWTGSNSEFFWATNYYKDVGGNITWVTNFKAADPIRYISANTWTNFAPILRPDANAVPITIPPTIPTPSRLRQCRCLLPYKGRLLAFNTVETDNTGATFFFKQRLRYSQNGTPLQQGVIKVNPSAPPAYIWDNTPAGNFTSAWADDIPGYGGYIDAPTSEELISVEFIKDTLIVKFERSSWKVIYTGNEILPFVFEKVNTELGSESTFSLIPFDQGVFSVGNYGITTDNSVNVVRIDQRIPNVVLDFNNKNDGVFRVHGIRDFAKEMVYWTFPYSKSQVTFPDRVLAYNYVNETFAIFKDSFTCYGFYQKPTDLTWATLPWINWNSWTGTWNSGATQSKFPDVIAGNQQGFVSVVQKQIFNDVSLTIKNIVANAGSAAIFTVPNHNLQEQDFIRISGILSFGTGQFPTLNHTNFMIAKRIDDNTFTLQNSLYNDVILVPGDLYIGGGLITVIDDMQITTKTFAPFYENGSQVRLGYIDFLLDKTSEGEVSSQIFIDECDAISINETSSLSGVSGNLGSNVLLTRPENPTLLPFQKNQDKIWHRVFVQCQCQNFLIWITFKNDQLFSWSIASSDFTLHAMNLYLSKGGRLTQ